MFDVVWPFVDIGGRDDALLDEAPLLLPAPGQAKAVGALCFSNEDSTEDGHQDYESHRPQKERCAQQQDAQPNAGSAFVKAARVFRGTARTDEAIRPDGRRPHR